jgi:hypothetical protein
MPGARTQGHFIVHAEVVEAEFTLHRGKLLPPVGSQSLIGAAGADTAERDCEVESGRAGDVRTHDARLRACYANEGESAHREECNMKSHRVFPIKSK